MDADGAEDGLRTTSCFRYLSFKRIGLNQIRWYSSCTFAVWLIQLGCWNDRQGKGERAATSDG